MKQGANLQLLVETDNLDEQPKLSSYEGMVWELFWRLNTERSFGMSVGPIPLGRIVDYLDRCGFGVTDSEEILETILALDSCYIAAKVRDAQKARESSK